ncbi:RpiB/LacA/LacB family sugar-phosphate isomerase [Candidatus Saccharibacteria bacterium]|nr:RpiB/LacA/LacB family sugar-phosphate isomerase [Candidatus Saccharibacteria bacterium]
MEIYIGADYRGFERKQQLIKYLVERGDEVHDEGVYEYHENGDDYNDPAVSVAKNVRENRGSVGVLICGSAHGVTIQANRFKGIRAAHCDDEDSAVMAREHDDANVLCLSAEYADEKKAKSILETFLDTIFSNIERRVRRINRLDEREDYD